MSDLPDIDLLAAEYVLGTLEGDERREAVRLLATDPAFARAVAVWQQRLTPLVAQVAPAAPPADLWGRIEANILPPVTADVLPFRRRVRFWQELPWRRSRSPPRWPHSSCCTNPSHSVLPCCRQ